VSAPRDGGQGSGWYGRGSMDSGRSARSGGYTGVEGNMAITISSSLMAGVLVYGGLGWLLSRWLGHESLFIAGGVLLGVGLSLYLVNARLRQLPEPGTRADDDPAHGGR
jgi:ATP synthase protein I